MELSYKEEVGVGAMVILGLIAFTVGMFWLTGRSITSKGVSVPVVFKNISGLKEGDPVRVSGVKKGRVGQVRLERVPRGEQRSEGGGRHVIFHHTDRLSRSREPQH